MWNQQHAINWVCQGVQGCFDGLVANQNPIANDDKVIYMSRGMGQTYNVLVASMLEKTLFLNMPNLW